MPRRPPGYQVHQGEGRALRYGELTAARAVLHFGEATARALLVLWQGPGCEVHVTFVDKRLGPKFDLTQSKARQRYLDLVDQGYFDDFDVVLLSPPCATFFRATWANFSGPRPVRSFAKPRGIARDRHAHGKGKRPCDYWQHFC